MNRALTLAIALGFMPGVVSADVKIYGKANVSFEAVTINDSTNTELVSNSSRLGFKGEEAIRDEMKIIYVMEYEVYFDSDNTFNQRNIYVGIEGNFGQIRGGHFDTPLKSIKYSVDKFGDMRGDIKRIISVNENRTGNTVQYTTPVIGGLRANAAFISSEEDSRNDGKSFSVSWSSHFFYLAGAFETDVEQEGSEASRAVAQLNLDTFQIGLLYEQYKEIGYSQVDGWIVSAQKNLMLGWNLKAQYGRSDQKLYGGETLSGGLDYKLSDKSKLFGFYTRESADESALEGEYVGLGMEVNF